MRRPHQVPRRLGDGQGHLRHPLRRGRGGDHEHQHGKDLAAVVHVFLRPRGHLLHNMFGIILTKEN